jgi:hypothetical protein
MAMKTRILGIALAAVTALAGCNSDSTGFQPIDPGSLAFSFEGARTGTYSASGAFTANNGNAVQALPFAAGVKINNAVAGQIVGIIAWMPVGLSTGHQATFLLPPVTAAGQTFALTEDCTSVTFCPGGLVAFDLSLTQPGLEPDAFVFTSGTLTITSLASGRVAGTFSGVAADSAGIRVVTITGGTFDVPLVDESRLGQ